jgi:hypothetical protein
MQIIKFETAILAKEKGFTKTCECFFDDIGDLYKSDIYLNEKRHNAYSFKNVGHCHAPYQTTVQDYLRTEHKIHITITSISQESWQYHITKPGESLGMVIGEDYDTYEEALEEGILNALLTLK